jgi:rhamnose transport system permease protein
LVVAWVWLSVLALGAAASGCKKDKAELTVAMMPKNKGNPYFVSSRKGAEEAARELGVKLLWDGPTDTDPARQNEVVETWITRGVDVIAASVESRDGLATVLRKARGKGIKVITWDADTVPDARDFFVNQATPEGIGAGLADRAAELLGGKGELAIVTASLTAANQNEWIKHFNARLTAKYPDVKVAVIRPSDDKQDQAFTEAQTILKVYPEVKVIVGMSAPAVPGIAEAVKQADRKDVKVTGLSLPNMCKKYIHEGWIDSIVLWNTGDLGYLTVETAAALGRGTLVAASPSLAAGRLGEIKVAGDQVVLGAPVLFDRNNVDQFDF